MLSGNNHEFWAATRLWILVFVLTIFAFFSLTSEFLLLLIPYGFPFYPFNLLSIPT